MATVTLKGNAFRTTGDLPNPGATAPDFKLAKSDLSDATLATYAGQRKVLNVFPSVDTPTCAASVRRFNMAAGDLPNVAVLCISADLPFAQARFCGAEGLKNVQTLSTFRSAFAKQYGLEFADGPLAGLCSRAVIVLDENNKVLHAEQVAETAHEPNYDAALAALRT